MKLLFAAVALTALVGCGSAHAQSEMDHRVQRAWDDLFNPPPPGDPRTNWERHRDEAHAAEQRAYQERAYQERQAAEHDNWCHYHPNAEGCNRVYGTGYYR